MAYGWWTKCRAGLLSLGWSQTVSVFGSWRVEEFKRQEKRTNTMNNYEFGEMMKKRTKVFAVQIVKFYKALPRSDEARVLGRQILRAGTSVAANYRAVCRAKSHADFVSKMGTVVEEVDETVLWLELLEAAEICPTAQLANLRRDAEDLLRIFSTSLATAKRTRERGVRELGS